MSCLVFPMNCSPGVLRIEISYLAILTGILSSILFYLIFFQSLWLHRAHVEDAPHLYVLFNNFFFLLKEALALAYDYITDSDGRCFIRTFVSKNFSEIGKKNESETLFNLSSNQTIFFYYSPIISPILMAGVSIRAFLSENLSGIGKKIIGNALKS